MKSIYVFIVLVIFIAISYIFIDAPLVFFIHSHGVNKFFLFKLFTHIPDVIIAGIIIYVILFPFLYKNKKEKKFFHMLFIATLSVSLSAQIKDILKYVFGRYWPDTWIEANPSLIINNFYGFNFFHKGNAYSSFPSGHTVATFSFFTICILFYPKYKIYFFIPMVLLALGQVFMHYHFLSDVVAGASIGFYVSKLICNYLSTLSVKFFS